MGLLLLTTGLTALDRNGVFYSPHFWEYSDHERPPVEQTERRPDLLKPQVQFPRRGCGGPWTSHSAHPPWASVLGKVPSKESSQVTSSSLSRVQPWPKELQEARQAESILPDQRVAEPQDGADQPELRREASKEGEVGQADFDASDQKHKGWERQGQR